MWAFSSCSERGLLFIAVHELLIVVVSLAAQAVGLQASVALAHGVSSCSLWALELRLSS